MARTRVDDPWRDEGEPERLEQWIREGFDRRDAELWRAWRFTLAQAREWHAAGVMNGLEAAQWTTARVPPTGVAAWRAIRVGATEAIQWSEFGFDLAKAKLHKEKGQEPAEAYESVNPPRAIQAGAAGVYQFSSQIRHVVASINQGVSGLLPGPASFARFLEAGVPPQVVHSYLSRQWLDDEALEWAKRHIDAVDARLWRDLGLRPAEARRVAAGGAVPGDVIREWWRAGIPFDEVADWLGAGCTASEARSQRAEGVTAEQAAALRALRRDDED